MFRPCQSLGRSQPERREGEDDEDEDEQQEKEREAENEGRKRMGGCWLMVDGDDGWMIMEMMVMG
jgi:hypothetical protein